MALCRAVLDERIKQALIRVARDKSRGWKVRIWAVHALAHYTGEDIVQLLKDLSRDELKRLSTKASFVLAGLLSGAKHQVT